MQPPTAFDPRSWIDRPEPGNWNSVAFGLVPLGINERNFMLIESLENRQMFSATIDTNPAPVQPVEPAVPVTVDESACGGSAFKQVGLGMRKSAGGQASGVMFLS
jgi:hypothetical protein